MKKGIIGKFQSRRTLRFSRTPSNILLADVPDVDPLAALQDSNGFKLISSQLTCKICLISTVGIIFLPCGHLGESLVFISINIFIQLFWSMVSLVHC